MKKIISTTLAIALSIHSLASIAAEQREVKLGETTVLINEQEQNDLNALKIILSEKKKELMELQGQESRGMILYDVGNVLQQLSALMATASYTYGKMLSEPTLETRFSGPLDQTKIDGRLSRATRNRIALERLDKITTTKVKYRMPPNIRRIGLGAMGAWFVLSTLTNYQRSDVLWTAEQKEILILQIEHIEKQIADLENGLKLLEEDPIDLFLQDQQ